MYLNMCFNLDASCGRHSRGFKIVTESWNIICDRNYSKQKQTLVHAGIWKYALLSIMECVLQLIVIVYSANFKVILLCQLYTISYFCRLRAIYENFPPQNL